MWASYFSPNCRQKQVSHSHRAGSPMLQRLKVLQMAVHHATGAVCSALTKCGLSLTASQSADTVSTWQLDDVTCH